MVDRRNGPNVTPREPSSVDPLAGWERKFRTEFARDCGAKFEPLIERFGLKGDAKSMLEGTIDFVTAVVTRASVDGVEIEEFLADQCYDGQPLAASYSLTFDVARRGAARLLVAPSFTSLDLADLHEHPWDHLEAVGYTEFWVTRLDGHGLTLSELAELERVVTEDIRFDFRDDEVWLGFDPDSYDKALAVSVYDAPEGLSQSGETL